MLRAISSVSFSYQLNLVTSIEVCVRGISAKWSAMLDTRTRKMAAYRVVYGCLCYAITEYGAVTVISVVRYLTIIHGPIKDHFSFTLLSCLEVWKRKGFCSLCLLLKHMHLRDKPEHKLPKPLHTLVIFTIQFGLYAIHDLNSPHIYL